MHKESEIENIKNTLADMSHHWDAEALYDVIYQEFSRADRCLVPEIIDAACFRLMALENILPTKENLHQYEEKILIRILRAILALPYEN